MGAKCNFVQRRVGVGRLAWPPRNFIHLFSIETTTATMYTDYRTAWLGIHRPLSLHLVEWISTITARSSYCLKQSFPRTDHRNYSRPSICADMNRNNELTKKLNQKQSRNPISRRDPPRIGKKAVEFTRALLGSVHSSPHINYSTGEWQGNHWRKQSSESWECLIIIIVIIRVYYQFFCLCSPPSPPSDSCLYPIISMCTCVPHRTES